MTENIKSGIYYIENTITNKKYIGQSSKIYTRWNQHKNKLNNNKHPNIYLQASWNRHGENAFTFCILEYCNVEELDERENYWIDFYNTLDRTKGYNLKSGGQNGGSKYSLESRKKMSESQIELCKNPERIEQLREIGLKVWSNDKYKASRSGENHPLHGQHLSEEIRKKISDAMKGKPKPSRSKQHCEAISKAHIGKSPGNKNLTPVRCIELDLEFSDAITAGKELGIKSPNHVIDVCKGRRKTCGGYHFEFANNG